MMTDALILFFIMCLAKIGEGRRGSLIIISIKYQLDFSVLRKVWLVGKTTTINPGIHWRLILCYHEVGSVYIVQYQSVILEGIEMCDTGENSMQAN